MARTPGTAPSLTDRRLGLYIGFAALAYYLLTLGGHHYSIDGILLFQTAKALVFHHSLVPDPPVLWMGAPRTWYWGIGMILAYVPWLLVWSPLFEWAPSLKAVPYDPSLPANAALYENIPYLLCSGVNPLATAATASFVFAIGRRLDLSRGWAVVAAGTYAVASPAVAYARQDFSQPLAGLALTIAAWALLEPGGRGRFRPLFVAGASLAYAILCRFELVAVLAWTAGWVLLRERHRGLRAAFLRASALGAAPAVTVLVGLWIRRRQFGQPTGFPPWSVFAAVVLPDSGADILVALAGHLISPGRGLLLFFPLAWLVVPGLWRLARGRRDAAVLLGGLIGLSLGIYGAVRTWWAGVSWGPRFFVPFLSLMVIAAAVWAARAGARGRTRAKAIFVLLAALGLIVSWNAILVDINEYTGWAVRTHGVAPDVGSTQFSLRASPLVSGWFFQTGLPIDSLWVRLWDPMRVPMLREPLAAANARLGVDLAGYGWVVGLGVPLLLVGWLGWALQRLLALLESQIPAEGAFGAEHHDPARRRDLPR